MIRAYLDKLDSTSTSLEEKTQIVCKDYSNRYKKELHDYSIRAFTRLYRN